VYVFVRACARVNLPHFSNFRLDNTADLLYNIRHIFVQSIFQFLVFNAL